MSTLAVVQYIGGIPRVHQGDIIIIGSELIDKSLLIYIENPDVLMIFPHMHHDIPQRTHGIPQRTHGIPQCTHGTPPSPMY